MRWDISINTNGQQDYSTVDHLSDAEQDMRPYAYCLPRYAKMDGGYSNTPDAIPVGECGYVSTYLSGADGTFQTNPTITIRYDRLKTSDGLKFVFNRLSNDYASRISIGWYKDDELVETMEFAPDEAEYFCEAKVKLFNRIEIEFLQTSKPYRYLWIASIKNRKMTDGGGLKIVYEDIALGALEDGTATSDDCDHYVDMTDLKNTVDFPDYAYCLPRYAKMDGSYSNTPDAVEHMGFVSEDISGADGVFAEPPEITFEFTQNYSSVGITLRFNDYSEDYCSLVNIKWYRGNELLEDVDFEPDGYEYFCYQPVEYYNKVVITFKKTSKPYRKVFLTGIMFGLNRVFRDDEIEDINCILEISPISEELSVNTMEYTLKSKSDYQFSFQSRQKQTLYFDEGIVGIFYLKDGTQMEAKRYSIQTEDAVGILDRNQFDGGIYDHVLVSEVLAQIMIGEDIAYFLDDTYSVQTITGYIPICTKREALQQIAFAIGAVVNTAYDRQLYIAPRSTQRGDAFEENDIYLGVSVEHSDIVSGIRLYAHRYTESEETIELYDGVLNGSVKVEFSEPCHSLSIAGGTITASDANYAYITGTGEAAVLSGKKYNHSTVMLLKENEKITRNKNIAEVQEATLVTMENAQEVLNRVYEYYSNNESVHFRSVINDQLLGNVASVATGFRGTMQGTIQKLEMGFSRRKVVAEVTVK